MPLDKTPWTDETQLPWGAHKGLKLKDVPPAYLLWLSQQRWIPEWPGLCFYLRSPEAQARIETARKAEAGQIVEKQTIDTFEDYLKDYRGF